MLCEWCRNYPAYCQIGRESIPMWLICRECLRELSDRGGIQVD